jgi:opine dehydrogenase
VLFTPGSFGSYAVARDLARAGGPLPFASPRAARCRISRARPGRPPCRRGARGQPAGGRVPGLALESGAGAHQRAVPATRPCVDALDVALTNAGPVIHPPLVLVNAASIDGGTFDIHAAGTTASARRIIDAVDAERIAARRGIGYPAPHYELATYYEEARAAEGLYGAGAKQKLVTSGLWREVLTYEHRYVSEDVALGLTLFESAGRMGAAPTPAISGLLGVFGALLGRDLAGGRALDHLGLGDLTRREVRVLLHEGWESHAWSRAIR